MLDITLTNVEYEISISSGNSMKTKLINIKDNANVNNIETMLII